MSSSKIKIVPKGWGYEKWICNTEEYCGKLLHIIKGKRCSWHYHTLKDETFYLQEGKLLVKYSDDDDRVLRHQKFDLEDSDLFEFSTHHFDYDSNSVIPGD